MMNKKSLLALLLACVMLLSGCSLVMRDSNVDAMQTILEVNGEHVTKQDFLSAYNYSLSMEQYTAQLMAQFGLSDGTVDESAVLQSTLSSYISSLVLTQKAHELGLDQISEADSATLDAMAQEQYQLQLDSLHGSYYGDVELSDEEQAALVELAANQGITLESLRLSFENELISTNLEKSVTDSVTIDDTDLQTALDALIESEMSAYQSDLGAYGRNANNGTATYYTPAGYRSIRMIKVAKPAATGDEAADTTQESAKAQELSARLTNGEAFDALGEEVTSAVVCADSTDLDNAIVEAAMALTEKGAYSSVVETSDSFVLVEYTDDVAEHTATLDETRDALYEDTLQEAKDAAYQAAVTEWMNQASVNMYLDRLN